MFRTALTALAAALILAPAAMAERPKEAAAMRVAFGDVDTSTLSGGQTLLKRIDKAAAKVCGERWQYSAANPHGRTECRFSTIDSVVEKLGIATVNLAWNNSQPAARQLASR